MSLARGKFGIEFDPEHREKSPPGLKFAVAAVFAAAAVSLVTTAVSRIRRQGGALDRPPPPATLQQPPAAATAAATPAESAAQTAASASGNRPTKARNLQLRLQEAEHKRDLVLIVTTIEQMRDYPGKPFADIDDALARRLGELNIQWLFEFHNAQWVKKVRVKTGDFAIRIASEHGSTLDSFKRLNPDIDPSRLKTGSEVWVMQHPRLNLVAGLRSRTADLHLNGKFFKRYDIVPSASAKPGSYEAGGTPLKSLALTGIGIPDAADRAELAALLPRGATITVSDL